ncbi:Zinc finger protein C25B8.19c [Choanephora cucurbitarum]|uniref:Zinc finger protein C25B8.19c n=1 Tax=Choanephora cucurbitarum TaxID=101091 RepID=A0A1C7MZX0_9FUNG|nr:Zinc finger protein C25B8.19c [Choanephora cucurbitarum]
MMSESRVYLPSIQNMLHDAPVETETKHSPSNYPPYPPSKRDLQRSADLPGYTYAMSEHQRSEHLVHFRRRSAEDLNQKERSSHRRTASDITLIHPQSLNRYRCHQCQKTFSRPSSLRIHILSHTGEKPHVCPHLGCGKRFSVQSNMRRHLKVHYCNPTPQKHN